MVATLRMGIIDLIVCSFYDGGLGRISSPGQKTPPFW